MCTYIKQRFIYVHKHTQNEKKKHEQLHDKTQNPSHMTSKDAFQHRSKGQAAFQASREDSILLRWVELRPRPGACAPEERAVVAVVGSGRPWRKQPQRLAVVVRGQEQWRNQVENRGSEMRKQMFESNISTFSKRLSCSPAPRRERSGGLRAVKAAKIHAETHNRR